MKKMNIFSCVLMVALIISFTSCSEDSERAIPKQSANLTTASLLKSIQADCKVKVSFKIKGTSTSDFDEAGATLDYIDMRIVAKCGEVPKFVPIWNTVEDFNLLNMTGGIMTDIGFLEIPSGAYDQARVHILKGWVIKKGKRYNCIFPGNRMTLVFKPAVIVGEHLSVDLSIDINVSSSFIPVGNPNNPIAYIFKPVVQVTNNTTTGTMIGAVVDEAGNPLGGARVSLNAEGAIYETYSLTENLTDEYGIEHFPGEFILPGVPAGNYTAFAEKTGYTTGSLEITIVKGNYNSSIFTLSSGQ